MASRLRLPLSRCAAAVAAAGLLGVWVATQWSVFRDGPDLLIRFTLGGVFALLIAARPKPARPPRPRRALPAAMALAGTLCFGIGLVLGVRQLTWLGVLGIVGACLGWALPAAAGRDALRAMILLYWAHPLPTAFSGALQLTMQQLSVSGSAILLHALNVRVWADGMVLRTPFHVYEVPAWCSGMRTATTVFILALGLSLLKRLAAFQTILALAAALLQALGLNILRITAMVLLVPHIRHKDGIAFLHDTAGLIVLAAVALTYLEITLLQRRQRRVVAEQNELNPALHRILRERPRAWAGLLRHPVPIAALLGVSVLTAFLAYKQRPSHRANMYREVAEELRDRGELADAERVGRTVMRLAPHDDEWRLAMWRIMVMRGKFGDVLAALRHERRAGQPVAIERRVLEAYCLMGLRRVDETRAIVDALPEDIRDNDPRVAMILAELAFRQDDPDEVARRIRTAAAWSPHLARVRALYPFLRRHRRWRTIADTDPRLPYREPIQALAAAEAFMNLGLTADVARLARRAIDDWPRDPRVLIPLFYLAGKRPDDGWERRFGTYLARCLDAIGEPAELEALMQHCFQLRRPDLAWMLWRRIRALDPDHPALSMAPVRHGGEWFAFRRRFAGLSAGQPWETVDVTAAYLVARLSPVWADIGALVPCGIELAAGDRVAARKVMLDQALAAFRRQRAAGAFTRDMHYAYAEALHLADDLAGARAELDARVREHPRERGYAAERLSEWYQHRADWPNVYEVLRDVPHTPETGLSALLRLTLAQRHLGLGLAALETARAALDRYPESTQAAGALAMTLLDFDSPENALAILSRPRVRHERDLDRIEAEALYRTQRYAEFRRLTRAAVLPAAPLAPDLPQAHTLPPAELAAYWRLLFVPTAAEFAQHAARIREHAARTDHPFLHGLYTRWLALDDRPDDPANRAPERWAAVGRDAVEAAVALHQLCLALCRAGRDDEARAAARLAVEYLPGAAQPWRYLIGLSPDDPAVLEEALEACPDDSEIWLAALVARVRPALEAGPCATEAERLAAAMRAAVARDVFPPATLARAAELMLRAGYRQAAVTAARHATRQARGLLPVYLVGLRCAVVAEDREWALACTRAAIDAALVPPPALHRRLVRLQAADPSPVMGDDIVDALKNLLRAEPDNDLWPRLLAYVRFQRGGWEIVDALQNVSAAVRSGSRDRQTLIIGAECARLLRNTDRAVELLEQGLAAWPGDRVMLNNLAFTLADSAARAAEALALLPDLLSRAGGHIGIMDTIAYVYLRNGRFDEAVRVLDGMAGRVTAGTPDGFRRELRRAQIAYGRQRPAEAAAALQEILAATRGITDADLLAANRLLALAEQAAREREGAHGD